jgi:hypothetical protein
MAEITLGCWIINTSFNEMFTVDTQTSKTVLDLKKRIMKAHPDAFTGADARELDLYKVSVPAESFNEQLQGLNSPRDVGSGAELMGPIFKLSKYFEITTDRHLHIIVQANGESKCCMLFATPPTIYFIPIRSSYTPSFSSILKFIPPFLAFHLCSTPRRDINRVFS